MNHEMKEIMNELNQKITARYASKKRYLCLMEDGSIKFLQRKPDDNQSSHMHGWMELKQSVENAVALTKAADYSRGIPEKVK